MGFFISKTSWDLADPSHGILFITPALPFSETPEILLSGSGSPQGTFILSPIFLGLALRGCLYHISFQRRLKKGSGYHQGRKNVRDG